MSFFSAYIAKLQIKAPPEIHAFQAWLSQAMDTTETHAVDILTYTPKCQISASLKICLHLPWIPYQLFGEGVQWLLSIQYGFPNLGLLLISFVASVEKLGELY